MKALHDFSAFGWFLAYVVSGLVLLGGFKAVYMWRTPYDDRKDISEGKMGPAIMLCGAMLGFLAPLLAASYVGANMLDYAGWAVISGALQIAWYYVGFAVWKAERANPYNVASSLVMATGSVCCGLIQAFSMLPPAAPL